MPSTVNGIGTWYYGAKNVHVRQDECEHCGEYANIKSYDTTKYFVLLYIPVVPLGRQHIAGMCSSCEQHYAIPLKDWEQQKNDAIREDVASFQGDRYNTEMATALLKTCAGFYDKKSFLQYAAELETAVSSDADGLSLLASGYEYFDEPRRAEEIYRKSLLVKDDVGTRTALGILLIKEGRPVEAKQYLWHLLSPLHGNDAGTLYFLVEGYQAQGNHMEAKRVLDEMVRVFPALEGDETFESYRKRVQKRLGSTKRVPSELLKGVSGESSGIDWSGSTATFVSAAAVIAILASVGFLFFSRTQRADVYLVNGLDHAYSVRIGETTHHLKPYAPIEVTVPRHEGLVAQVSELGWQETIDIELPTQFWDSFRDSRTYVLNPDHVAVILWEQTEYAVNPVEKDLPYRLHLGRGFYAFEDLDYVFTEFPNEIELSSASQVAKRERITRYAGLEPITAYAAALEFVSPEDGFSYLKHALRANPNDVTVLGAVAGLATPDEFAALARPHLEQRPLRMEWHRMYQSVLEMAGTTDELVQSYRALVEADPENPDLKYLLSRITPDPVAAERLLREAIEGPSPSAYGFHGLAYQRLVEANFAEAHRLALRARELDPEADIFAYVEEGALLGLRRFDVLVDRSEAVHAVNTLDGELVAQLVRLYTASGDTASADAVIDAYLQEIGAEGGDDVWRSYLQSIYHLGTGNWNGFRDASGGFEEPRLQFQHALALGDYTAGIEVLTSSGEQTAVDHLLVYLGAVRAKDHNLAEAQLGTAVEILSASSIEERVLAECLSGKTPASRALPLTLEPETKAVGLAVLASRYGDARARQLARKLNYDLSFNRHFLDRIGF